MPDTSKQKSKLFRGITVKRIVIWIVILALVAVYIIYENNVLRLRKETVASSKLPSSFDGFKIVHISDLHDKQYGDKQTELAQKVKDIQPDLIVITGDLVDFNRTNLERSLNLVRGIKGIAPIYYVTGNHEACISEYDQLKDELISCNVTVLENQTERFYKGGEYINIIGLTDTDFPDKNYPLCELDKRVRREMTPIMPQDGGFELLLAHRPEYFEIYADFGVDLALTGHAHGGQFRLPFTDGLYAPSQGILPKYTSGPYTDGNTTMIVSKGLGNSSFPIRINNRPELVIITLKCK